MHRGVRDKWLCTTASSVPRQTTAQMFAPSASLEVLVLIMSHMALTSWPWLARSFGTTPKARALLKIAMSALRTPLQMATTMQKTIKPGEIPPRLGVTNHNYFDGNNKGRSFPAARGEVLPLPTY